MMTLGLVIERNLRESSDAEVCSMPLSGLNAKIR